MCLLRSSGKPYHTVEIETALCITAKLIVEWPSRVKTGGVVRASIVLEFRRPPETGPNAGLTGQVL